MVAWTTATRVRRVTRTLQNMHNKKTFLKQGVSYHPLDVHRHQGSRHPWLNTDSGAHFKFTPGLQRSPWIKRLASERIWPPSMLWNVQISFLGGKRLQVPVQSKQVRTPWTLQRLPATHRLNLQHRLHYNLELSLLPQLWLHNVGFDNADPGMLFTFLA